MALQILGGLVVAMVLSGRGAYQLLRYHEISSTWIGICLVTGASVAVTNTACAIIEEIGRCFS